MKQTHNFIHTVTMIVLCLCLLFSLGCQTQVQSDLNEDTQKTKAKFKIPLPATSQSLSYNLSLTTLKFGMSNCRSSLKNINTSLDKVTAKTQTDYWQVIKQRFSRCTKQFTKLQNDWSKLKRHETAKEVSIQEQLSKLERLLQETDNRIKMIGQKYPQQRQAYEQRRRETFLKQKRTLVEINPKAPCFYEGTTFKTGVTDMETTLNHVLVTLESYTNEHLLPHQTNRLSPLTHLEDYVVLEDENGHRLGEPEEIKYDRLHSNDGLIVTIAFAYDSASERKPHQLRIYPSPLGNSEQITLIPPHHQTCLSLTQVFDEKTLLGTKQTPDSETMQVIHCKRENMHLKVPVTLNIHGVTVQTSMLLDTGASITVLSKSIYKQGMARPLAELDRMRLTTANGQMLCPVDTLSVSTSAYAKEIPVALSDSPISLLGANYLAGHRLTIDLEKECIYVHSHQH